MNLAKICSKFDPYDQNVSSVHDRYPTLTGNLMVSQLRRLYMQRKETLPWLTSSGRPALIRHDSGKAIAAGVCLWCMCI
jgi:hypothetical protein